MGLTVMYGIRVRVRGRVRRASCFDLTDYGFEIHGSGQGLFGLDSRILGVFRYRGAVRTVSGRVFSIFVLICGI